MNYRIPLPYNSQFPTMLPPSIPPQYRRPSMPCIIPAMTPQRRQSLPIIPLPIDKPGPGKVKSKFTPQEDAMLEQLVNEHGEGYWDKIAEHMPGRNARQCKDRWTRYLSPELNKGEWTPEEEELLIQLVYELNFRWVHIAKRFKGRTDNQIKNKWNVLKKYLDQQPPQKVKGKSKRKEKDTPEIPSISSDSIFKDAFKPETEAVQVMVTQQPSVQTQQPEETESNDIIDKLFAANDTMSLFEHTDPLEPNSFDAASSDALFGLF